MNKRYVLHAVVEGYDEEDNFIQTLHIKDVLFSNYIEIKPKPYIERIYEYGNTMATEMSYENSEKVEYYKNLLIFIKPTNFVDITNLFTNDIIKQIFKLH